MRFFQRTGIREFWRVAVIAAAWLAIGQSGFAGAKAERSPWEDSIVTVEVTRRQYDFIQPWTQRNETYKKQGVVLGPNQILTTADYLNDLSLARLQKNGRGPWVGATLAWIDYHADLAVLTTTNAEFWRGLKTVSLADPAPTAGSLQIMRWRNGNLENRKGEIARLAVRRSRLSFIEHLTLEVDSEINGAGWSEAVTIGGKLAGLTTSQDGNNCLAIPAPFIKFAVQGATSNPRRQMGFFDFVWQKAENPATLAQLKLTGEPRGVIIIDKASGADKSGLLKPKDILLQIEGFKIDTDGNYTDPNYGQLLLENLSTRGKYAGDKVRLTLWRDGQQLEVAYPLPRAEYNVEMVPEEVFDQAPEYLVAGGLVFEPLSEPFLRSWGAEWKRKAPFRLTYFDQEKPSEERPARVLLTIVLPDPFNLGYQDYRFLPVDKVNGKIISRMPDLVAAFQQPQNGYHHLEFGPGESVRTMILEAASTEAATRRVMEKYGVPKEKVINQP
jgi:hypothetical protein